MLFLRGTTSSKSGTVRQMGEFSVPFLRIAAILSEGSKGNQAARHLGRPSRDVTSEGLNSKWTQTFLHVDGNSTFHAARVVEVIALRAHAPR